MKQFKLLILLLVIGFVGEAQINYLPIKSRYKLIAGLFDSTLHIPSGTTPSLRTGGYTGSGALFYKTSDSTVYVYTGTQWVSVKGSGGGGSADSTVFATLYRLDTAKVAIRLSIAGKLNISDTANMRPRLYAGSNVTITGTYPNLTIASSGGGGSSDTSTFIVDTTYNRLAYAISADSLWLKSIRIQQGGVDVTPTVTDSTLSWNITGVSGSGVTTVGAFSGSSQTNGASISGTTITFGPADGTNPGMVTTGTQTIAGAKTLTSNLTISKATPVLDLDATAGNYGYIKIDDAAGQPNYISGETGLTYRTTLSSYKHSFYSNSRLVLQLENQSGLVSTGVLSMYGQVTSNYTGTQGTDKGAFHLERTIDDGATGAGHHGFVSKTTFRTGAAAFNSFYAQDVIGRSDVNQDHWAGMQTRITKDSANTVSNLYDFVALGALMNGGTATNRYGYYMFDANNAGGGTLTNQYGIYIPTLTGGTNNWAAYFGARIQIQDGTQGNGKVLTSDANGIASWQNSTAGVDSIWRTAGVDSIKWRKNGVTYAIKDSVGAGGSASPGGSDTYVQFNDGGSFGGDAGLTYDKTNNSIKQAGVGASLSGYMQTNSGQLASTTNLNPGILVYNGSNNPYGVDLGYNSIRYATRVFAASGNISFGTMAAGSTLHSNFTELMFLNSTGLGIGITSPSEKLDVSGNGKFTGTLATGDPGSGSGSWKLGVAVTTSGLTLNTTTYVEVSIGGTVYRLAVVDPPQP